MFKKKQQPAQSSRPRAATTGRPVPVESAISIIGPGMVIEGDVVTEGTVRIEGTVRGTVRASKAVVLGKTGEIIGDLQTKDAVIGGRVDGVIVAESRLELQGTCTIEGEVRAAAEHILLHEGARFNGNIKMIGAEEQQQHQQQPSRPVAQKVENASAAAT